MRRLHLNDLPKEALEKFPLNLFRIILDSEQKALTTAQNLVRQLPQQHLSAQTQEIFVEVLINLLLSKLPQMSRKKMSLKFVSEVTGLSPEEIRSLKKAKEPRA